MADKVLVDTSVWIAFFRDSDKIVSERVKELLKTGKPLFCGLIATELVRGAKTNKELNALDDLFNSIGCLEMKEDYFIKAGELGRTLSSKGITTSTVDLLIAYIAIENDVPLFTLDAHFKLMAQHSSLRLFID